MKNIFSTVSAVVTVVFLTFAFTPVQAGPLGFARNAADNISATGVSATEAGFRNRGFRRGRGFRSRGFRRDRGFRNRGIHRGRGFRSRGFRSDRSFRRHRGFYSPYGARYDRGPGYTFRYGSRSNITNRIFQRQAQDGP